MREKSNKYLTREEFFHFLKEDRRRWKEHLAEDRRRWKEYLAEDRKKWKENQKKWEENQKKWEENQKKWEENQIKWEENQKKWEQHLAEDKKKWEENQKVIRGMLSQLSKHGDFIGFGIEGLACALLPYYLESTHGLVTKELRKEVLFINGKQVEINLFGLGRIGRKRVAVLVECKSTVGPKSIRAFLKKVRLTEPYLRSQGMEVIKMVFGPLIYPDAARIARREGIELVSSVPHKV